MATISTNDIVVNYKLGDVSGLAQLEGKLSNLTKDEQAALAEAKRLTAQFQKMGNEGKAGAEKVSQGVNSARSSMGNLGSTINSIGTSLGIAFSGAAIVAFGKEVINITAKFEQLQKAITFASGSIEEGQKSMAFIRRTASSLGLDLLGVAEGYKTFAASSKMAGQSTDETNRQFLAVTKAVAAMGLSTDDAKGVFLALGQIMSKGTVQAEELRGQIGERLPGAFNLAAKSMGVTTAQLNKMLQQGQVISAEFLPKFATELEKTFGAEAAKNINTLTASQNKFGAALDSLMVALGTTYQGRIKSFFDTWANNFDRVKGLIDPGTAMFDKGMQQSMKLSQQALKIAINNKNAEIRQLKEQYRLRAEIVAADGEMSDLEKVMVEQLADKITMQQKFRDGMFANLKTTEDTAKATEQTTELTAEQIKLLKAEFNERKKLLEIQREYEVLLKSVEGNVPEPQAKLGAEVNYLKSLESLQREYAAKGVDITKTEIEITKLNRQKANEELISEENQFQLQIKDASKGYFAELDKQRKEDEEKRRKSQEDRIKAAKEAADAELAAEKKLQEEKQKAREEAERMAIDLAQMTVNSIFNLQSQYAANDLARKQRQFDEEIRLADGNVQKITEIEEKRRAAEKEARLKQFRADQMQAIANAIFTAAPYIIKYTAGLPVTAANLSLTLGALAAQTGFILAQPVPEFAKGVENFEGGPAIVGEKGRELVRTDSGSYLTPDRATLTYLPRGADVITAPKTRELLAGNSTLTRGRNEWSAIDTAPIAKAIMGMPVQSLEISERGLERYVTKGNRTTKILNKKRGANL
jgi:tape measure domain-containing protein